MAKESLDNYPSEYKKTRKNCVDCQHFKIKLKLYDGGKRGPKLNFSTKSPACCTKKYIVRVLGTSIPTLQAKEPIYQFTSSTWIKVERGWRHTEWNTASVCPYFKNMREDHASNRKKDPIPNHVHDSDGYALSGLVPKMDISGSALGETPPGSEVLQNGDGEGIGPPEINAAEG